MYQVLGIKFMTAKTFMKNKQKRKKSCLLDDERCTEIKMFCIFVDSCNFVLFQNVLTFPENAI